MRVMLECRDAMRDQIGGKNDAGWYDGKAPGFFFFFFFVFWEMANAECGNAGLKWRDEMRNAK